MRKDRTIAQLLRAWDKATREKPLVLRSNREGELFSKGLRERAKRRVSGSAAQISEDYKGYTCPITGDWVEGRRAHRENLKKHGCRVFEKGEREHYEKNHAKEHDLQLDKSAAKLAEIIVSRLPD